MFSSQAVHRGRPRLPLQLLLLLTISALSTRAQALSLSDFHPQASNLTPSCNAIYTQTIPDCGPSDFSPASCSSACIASLVTVNQEVYDACAGNTENDQFLIGAFLVGQGITAICPNVVVTTVAAGGSYGTSMTTKPQSETVETGISSSTSLTTSSSSALAMSSVSSASSTSKPSSSTSSTSIRTSSSSSHTSASSLIAKTSTSTSKSTITTHPTSTTSSDPKLIPQAGTDTQSSFSTTVTPGPTTATDQSQAGTTGCGNANGLMLAQACTNGVGALKSPHRLLVSGIVGLSTWMVLHALF